MSAPHSFCPRDVSESEFANSDSCDCEVAYDSLSNVAHERFQSVLNNFDFDVHGKSGKVGAPRTTRVQLVHLGLLAVSLPVLSKELLQSLLGSLVYPLSHRKVYPILLFRMLPKRLVSSSPMM